MVLRLASEIKYENEKKRKTEINSFRLESFESFEFDFKPSLNVLPSCTWNRKSIGTLDLVLDSVYNDVYHFPALVVQNIFHLRLMISYESKVMIRTLTAKIWEQP